MNIEDEIRKERLAEFRSIGPHFLDELLITFFTSSSRTMEMLAEFIRLIAEGNLSEEDARNLKSLLHNFKGSISNMGFVRLSSQMDEMSRLGKEGDFEGCASLFSALQEEYKRLEALWSSGRNLQNR